MATKKDIVDLETKFWTAIRDRDSKSAVALMTEPCMVAGAQGAMPLTREDYIRMSGDSSWELHDFKLDKVDVRFPTDDVAIIGYVVDEDLTIEGKKLELKAAETSTWVKRDGKWLCASHTESILGDPFGRDRQPISLSA